MNKKCELTNASISDQKYQESKKVRKERYSGELSSLKYQEHPNSTRKRRKITKSRF